MRRISIIGVLLVLVCFLSCKKKDPRRVTLTEEEKSWMPYEEGDTIRFRSNLDSLESWIMIEKKEINFLQQGPWGSGVSYMSEKYRFEEMNSNQRITIGYDFSSSDEVHLFSFYEGKGLSTNSDGDECPLTSNVSTLKFFDNNKFYFLFTKNEGLTSYKTDSQQVYEKY